jgi:ABC-type multidrug transport system ATPase subunit
MTSLQNLNFFSGIYPIDAAVRQQIVAQMLNIFNLSQYADIKSSQLPLGFKQRLALSCAIMHKPKVLFLDEPTSGVDPLTRREFWNHITSMVHKGVSIVITTHQSRPNNQNRDSGRFKKVGYFTRFAKPNARRCFYKAQRKEGALIWQT